MISAHVGIALAIVATLFSTTLQKADSRLEPAKAVRDAIQLLENDRHAEFLKTFLRPNELERVLATRTIEQAAAEFKAKRAQDLLVALRAASKMEPTISEDGSGAHYDFEKPIGGERRVSLVKIEARWYFR